MRKKVIFTSALGNIFDAYDANLYAVFAGLLAPVFFPSHDPFTALLASLMAFSLAFVTRPLGAILFGHLGDLFGRKRALSWCMMLMALPTLIIAILPTYNTLGILAPIVLIICRLLQGLCSGGELNGAIIFSIEHAKPTHAGRTAGFIAATGILGVLLALAMGTLLTRPAMPVWSWRLAFLAGGAICLFGAQIRWKLTESPSFETSNSQNLRSPPLRLVLTTYWRPLLITFLTGGVLSMISYILIAYMPIYLSRNFAAPLHIAILYAVTGTLSYMLFSLIGGRIYDAFQNVRPLLGANYALILLAYPLFLGVNPASPGILIFCLVILGALAGLLAGCGYPYLQTLFAPSVRYTGISLGFSLGGAVFGSTTPLLLLVLEPFAPFYTFAPQFLIGMSLLFLIGHALLKR